MPYFSLQRSYFDISRWQGSYSDFYKAQAPESTARLESLQVHSKQWSILWELAKLSAEDASPQGWSPDDAARYADNLWQCRGAGVSITSTIHEMTDPWSIELCPILSVSHLKVRHLKKKKDGDEISDSFPFPQFAWCYTALSSADCHFKLSMVFTFI